MQKIAVVTDSSVSLPADVVQQMSIHIVPVSIQSDGQTFLEGVDLTSVGLYELLRHGKMPTTSQPAPGDFLAVFQPLVEQGYHVLAVLITGKGSGTCASAQIAAEMLPDDTVTIFDSGTAAMGTGWQVIAAAQAAAAGWSLQQILARLAELRDHNHVYIAVPTLKFLQISGRVNLAQALLGALLNIKLIITAQAGLVVVKDKVRSWPLALNRMADWVQAASQTEPVAIAVQHADALSAAQAFYQKLLAGANVERGLISEMSASLAMHGGRGMMGVAYCPARLLQI